MINYLQLLPVYNYLKHDEHLTKLIIPSDTFQNKVYQNTHILKSLNSKLEACLIKRETASGQIVTDSIINLIKTNLSVDNRELMKSYYFLGAFYSITGNQSDAIKHFILSNAINEKYQDGEMNMRIIYFLGYAYNMIGDFIKSNDYFFKVLSLEKKKFGSNSVKLIPTYESLATSNIKICDYEKAIEYAKIGLDIVKSHPDSVSAKELVFFYQIKGVAYSEMADYVQAIDNLEKAEYIYVTNSLPTDEGYFHLVDNIATTYHYLGLKNKVLEYYGKSFNLALNTNYPVSFTLLKNYSIILGNNGMAAKGERILAGSLEKVMKVYSSDSREYYMALKNYAEYLRIFKLDFRNSLKLYLKCVDYIKRHEWDQELKDDILVGLSLSLMVNGESKKALETLQELLNSDRRQNDLQDPFISAKIDMIGIDKRFLTILNAKYQVLWDLYLKSDDLKTLEDAASTSAILVSVLEKVRLNMGEEESRLLLGDKYRDSYLNTIKCFYIYYDKTKNPEFLEKAYEYSEKSKVASLLASTREMNATQFHIPPDLANLEISLQRKINFYNAKIDEEKNKIKPDALKIRLLCDDVMSTANTRDSLKVFFEKNYPDYFSIKYNSQVLKLQNIPGIIGRNNNYLNYVVSDSALYILVVNRKFRQLVSFKIDSSFFRILTEFKRLLTDPQASINVRNDFILFREYGYELYSYLIKPIKEYIISDKLIISPDNILSYIPFETLLYEESTCNDLLYRSLPYVMSVYQISYAYSATLMAEYFKKNQSLINHAIAFAPDYTSKVNIDSLMISRQSDSTFLRNLPYAREEAVYVSKICYGRLCLNNHATELEYKNEAGKFDIIHLAMHTFLNDQDPMYSKMIFSKGNDTLNDGFFNTYEIYGIPLKAKMVVLSSCNTGNGILHSGEGILSLARGFIYSGSQSVVMSLWEVEDRSGTEIMKLFYKNLRKGYSKSGALKKSRINYLKKADQLRSHPFFWSTLVIYGSDAPLYYPITTIILILLMPVLTICFLIFYLRSRKYS